MIEVDGFSLITRLDETMLQKIANLTNGIYYHSEDEESLQDIYENVDLQLTVDPEMMEVISLFAGMSLILLTIGGLLSGLWLERMP